MHYTVNSFVTVIGWQLYLGNEKLNKNFILLDSEKV